jgi:hypothetical protein
MTTKTSARAERSERGHRSLAQQPIAFLGLFLAPLGGLLTAWAIHLYIVGWDWHGWVVPGSPTALGVTNTLTGAAAIVLAGCAWYFSDHRKPPMRVALTGSVGSITILLGVNIYTGPHRWWGFSFVIVSWVVAAVWSLTRLNVTRADPRSESTEEKETFFSRMGVSKLTKMMGRVIHDEKTGEPVRLDVDVQHDRNTGETAEVFGDGGLGAMESAAAAPSGLSSVTKDPDRADRSKVSIPLVDPFKRNISVGPLSAPGRSIAEWTTVADYANGQVGRFTIGGGLHTPSPTSYALIGMTRAGKTGTETQLLTDWGSRCDWVCLYLNQAKGLQDVRPLLPIIEAAIIAEGEGASVDLAAYRTSVKKVRSMMAYRQSVLGQFGVSAWTPRCALPDDTARPSRVVSGTRQAMPRMPFLTVHLGEADVLFSDGRLADDYIYVSSKALSLGINTGTSLQKPDFRSMPTNVRSQIGLWLIHGLAESDDEEFVMDLATRKAGANPGMWKAKKPGQHYMIGNGVEHEELAPVALKTRFLIGTDTAPDGRRFTFDELNERYMAEMLRRNLQSAKTQARLDGGTADATEGWWAEQVANTDALRSRMLGSQGIATDPVATATDAPVATATASQRPVATPRNPADIPPAFRGRKTSQPATDDDDDDETPTAEEMDEMHEEAAEVTEVEGIELYDDPEVRDVDLSSKPAPAPEFATDEDDPLFDAEEDAKPAPRDRGAALDALAVALTELLQDESLRDPADPTGKTVIIGPGMVADRYKFRERPWFSAELTALAEGQGALAQRFDLKLAEDLGIRQGKYRLCGL